VLILIMLMYLVLGCLMDAMAMIILDGADSFFPVITALGFRSRMVRRHHRHDRGAQASSIYAVGMNVFVIKSVVKDRQVLDDLLRRHPFRDHRHHPARDPDPAADHRDVSPRRGCSYPPRTHTHQAGRWRK